MAAPKRYEITFKSAMQWANAELEHVGRIAAVMDPDIQYAYAMSTLNGMAHLKDALYELVTDAAYETHQEDLRRTHDAVIRTMRHLKNEYNLDVDAIRAFNTKGTLSDLAYLEEGGEIVGNDELYGNNYVSNNMNMTANTIAANGMNAAANTVAANTMTPNTNRNTRSQMPYNTSGGKRTSKRTSRRTRYRSRRSHHSRRSHKR